jgi:hypothetical protein
MGNELIRPIDADTAHAIEEAAKAAGKSVDAVTQGGMYVGWVLGDLPRDLVGIFGDWLLHKRVRRWAEMCEETGDILRKRGIEHQQSLCCGNQRRPGGSKAVVVKIARQRARPKSIKAGATVLD